MYYYEPQDKVFTSVQDFSLQFRDTSFGDLYQKEYRESIKLFDVLQNRPKFDPDLEVCEAGDIQLVDGKYTLNYIVSQKPLTEQEIFSIKVHRLDSALTEHLDSVARSRRYDSRITCALRAGYPGPFQAEGQAFATWMDTCNALAYTLLAEIQQGTRPMPTDPQELIDLLPEMQWP